MSCGVRYEFSIVNVPKAAKILIGEVEQLGTPQDAAEAGPADVRRSERDLFTPDDDTPHGRQRLQR